jgi:hypothetical protein
VERAVTPGGAWIAKPLLRAHSWTTNTCIVDLAREADANIRIHNIDTSLKRRLAERARVNGRSVSEEVRAILEEAVPDPPRKGLGTLLLELVPPEFRGDDLVFERDEPVPEPTDLSSSPDGLADSIRATLPEDSRVDLDVSRGPTKRRPPSYR